MTDTRKPLEECTILITRTIEQSKEVVDYIHSLGGTVICFPMIEITGPDSWDACDRSIVKIKKYNGVIFTSANAVRGFVSRIESNFPHVKAILKSRTIYAVGEKTREELLKYSIETDVMPDTYTAEAVVEMITGYGAEGKTFLLPAGNLTRDVIENGLSKAGAVVDRVQVYTTNKPDQIDSVRLKQLLTDGRIDIVTFFSPSSVHNFFELIDPAVLKNIPFAVIGDTTYKAVTDYDLHPVIKPEKATGDKLVDRIADYIQNKN